MIFNDGELAALEAEVQNIGVFFRLDTDPAVRLWGGAFNIEPGVSVLDEAGAVYLGFGELRDIPRVKQLLNGAAERVEFTMSGVDGAVLAMAASDAGVVKGKRVSLGVMWFSESFAPLGPIHWVADYVADFLAIEQQQASALAPVTRLVKLSCGSRFTGRRRPALSYFSDQDQEARHPGDRIFALVGNYAHGFSKQWPKF